jgi:hypothetical protein
VLAGRPDVVLLQAGRDVVEELIMVLEELGLTQDQYQRFCKMTELGNDTLGPKVTNIKKCLRKQLGFESDYEVRNIGERGSATYRLPLRPEQITIHGFNRDDILARIRANGSREAQA